MSLSLRWVVAAAVAMAMSGLGSGLGAFAGDAPAKGGIETLPYELFGYVGSYLTWEDAKEFSEVSRKSRSNFYDYLNRTDKYLDLRDEKFDSLNDHLLHDILVNVDAVEIDYRQLVDPFYQEKLKAIKRIHLYTVIPGVPSKVEIDEVAQVLQKFSELTDLALYGANMYGDLSSLSSLAAQLTSLEIPGSFRMMGDLASVEPLKKLRHLSLSLGTLRGDVAHLAGLVELRSLNLDDCGEVMGKLSSLASLTQLTDLRLHSTEEVKGTLSDLKPLTHLTRLSILFAGEGITGDVSELASFFPQLVDLTLCGTLVSGDIVPLARLKDLHTIYIEGTGVDLEPGRISEFDKIKPHVLHTKLPEHRMH